MDRAQPAARRLLHGKTAEEALQEVLADARRGCCRARRRSGRTFGDACSEWLRYIEHESSARRRRCGTTEHGQRGLLPEFGRTRRSRRSRPSGSTSTASGCSTRAAVAADDPEAARAAVRHPEAREAPRVDRDNPAEDVERVSSSARATLTC